jgi:hypothetical protein
MVSIIEPPSFVTAWSVSQASQAVNINRSLLGTAFAISSFEGRRFNRKAPLWTATASAIEPQ